MQHLLHLKVDPFHDHDDDQLAAGQVPGDGLVAEQVLAVGQVDALHLIAADVVLVLAVAWELAVVACELAVVAWELAVEQELAGTVVDHIVVGELVDTVVVA